MICRQFVPAQALTGHKRSLLNWDEHGMQRNASDETPLINSGVTPPTSSETLMSPSLQTSSQVAAHAYELKFLLPEASARELQNWAAKNLCVDAFANSEQDASYQTTTLYLDTPAMDLLHQTQKFRGRKYRLRRYGQEPLIYLERKRRSGDRVRKRRTSVPDQDVALVAIGLGRDGQQDEWFCQKIVKHQLQPNCCVTYERAAFMKMGTTGPMRLTFDRRIRGVRANDWSVLPVSDGAEILNGEVICEFKFREVLPTLFQQVIEEMQLQPASVSKYRRLMQVVLNQ